MRRVLFTSLIGITAAFAGVASAASVGSLTTATLASFQGSGASGAKTIYASDNFTGTFGASLSGRTPVIGAGTWVIGAGTWTINASNQASISGVPLGRAVVASGHADAKETATVMDSGQGGRTSGLVFRSDATASSYLSTYTQTGGGGRIFLAKRTGGATTTLTSATGVTFSNPATYIVTANGGTITISYNGTQFISYTLSAADQATFNSLGSWGLLDDNAATVSFDDFRVESL